MLGSLQKVFGIDAESIAPASIDTYLNANSVSLSEMADFDQSVFSRSQRFTRPDSLFDTTRLTDIYSQASMERGHRDSSKHYVSIRVHNTGDIEATGLCLSPGEVFKGGGKGRKNTEKSDMSDVDIARSQRRAKQNVRRKCLNFSPDRMLTLTFKENVTDLDTAWQCFTKFGKRCRKRFGDQWRYIVVPEFQKRGAVHFHLAISGFHSVRILRAIWRAVTPDNQGNVDITSPRKSGKNSWNPKRIANYIAKYITKEGDTVGFNAKRYASGGKIPDPHKIVGYISLVESLPTFLSELMSCISHKPTEYLSHNKDWREIAYITT